MDEMAVIEELEKLAKGLGIEIRYEPIILDEETISVVGGLCVLRGERLLIINSRAPVKDRVRAFAGALSRFDFSQTYLTPTIRTLLEKAAAEKENPCLRRQQAQR
jgi:hypothetical protein